MVVGKGLVYEFQGDRINKFTFIKTNLLLLEINHVEICYFTKRTNTKQFGHKDSLILIPSKKLTTVHFFFVNLKLKNTYINYITSYVVIFREIWIISILNPWKQNIAWLHSNRKQTAKIKLLSFRIIYNDGESTYTNMKLNYSSKRIVMVLTLGTILKMLLR